jgi:hypothetical protein
VYTVEYVDDSGVTRQMEIVPPNRIAPSMEVSIADAGNGLEYSYEVTNGTGNLVDQAIARIELTCPTTVTGEALSAPSMWFAVSRPSTHVDANACQFVARTGGVSPGATQTGYAIQSAYLPGIAHLLAWGRRADTESYSGIVDARPELIDVVRQVNGREGGWFEGIVIAPAIDPTMLTDARDGIVVLQSAVDEACGTSWIDDSNGICNSLEVKLEQAQASIVADRPSARYQVQAYLNELDAQRGQYVSEDAYWLLYVLGEYVLSTI